MAVQPKPCALHVSVDLRGVTPAETGKALGVLLRKNLTPQLMACTTERTNDTPVSRRAESVLGHLLQRPLPFRHGTHAVPLKAREIKLDDAQVSRLAREWASDGMPEYLVVVPHMFYLPLFKLFMNNIERHAPEVRKHLRFFFDYAPLDGVHEIVQRCFYGERARVMQHLRRVRVPYIDCGHQLLLENLITLACYMVPAKYLVFVDDDFFIRDQATIESLLEPLRDGYALSGIFVKRVQRIHTCLFAIRPECLRERLALFDNGENLYAEELRSTGSITYQVLAKRKKGVFHVADYGDGDQRLGRHLGHCTGELWGDMPLILRHVLSFGTLPKDMCKNELDAAVLLEGLAEAFHVQRQARDYEHIANDVRYNAWRDFPAYLEKVYSNYHWLMAQPGSC